jgi:hypothetical protein
MSVTENTCLIERSAVRVLVMNCIYLDNAETNALLAEIDALPIYSPADFVLEQTAVEKLMATGMSREEAEREAEIATGLNRL